MSAPIFAATARRCEFTSMANTLAAPHALATAIENRPMAPQPVTATVCAAIGPASTVCTALPRGSSNDAYSGGISGESFQMLVSGMIA